MSQDRPSIEQRLTILREFHGLLVDHSEGRFEEGKSFARMSEQKERYLAKRKHCSMINRRVEVVKRLVTDLGMSPVKTFWVKSTGGAGRMTFDVLDAMFTDLPGEPVLDQAIELLDKAIGAYEAMQSGELDLGIGGKETVDIENAIERSLRPAFPGDPPIKEKEITNIVEVILNSLPVDFTREKDIVTIGERGFCPDFALDGLGLAIEVKLAKEGHTGGTIQEEMAADISGYKTRWKRLLFVIYDVGVLTDPDRIKRDNLKHYGVSVVIVKH